MVLQYEVEVRHMAPATLDSVLEQAALLSPDEQLRLIAYLAEHVRAQAAPTQETSTAETPRRRSWREIRGSLPYPAFGEDAQAWISRTRRQGTERREQQWRKRS